MNEIAKLYDEVMKNEDPEKTASDASMATGAAAAAGDVDTGGETVLDKEFFSKFASGDEEATAIINNFISESQAQGASDEEIETAISEAMKDAGVDQDTATADDQTPEGEETVEDEHEVAKAAAYVSGSDKALEELLESDLAKEAGVTAEDLVDYDLGGIYAAGYMETRVNVEPVIQKIAAKKQASVEAEKVAAGATASTVQSLVRTQLGGEKTAGAKADALKAGLKNAAGKAGWAGAALGSKAVDAAKANPRKAIAAGMATGAAGLGAAGYGAKRMMAKKKDK